MSVELVRERNSDQKRGETVDFVVQHLLEGILHGRFAPGQRLVARELTEEMGISRGSVREAFRLMASDGLVDLVPNKGVTVRRLSRRQTRDLFEIREVLEGLAAKLAAQRIGVDKNRSVFEAMWETVRPRDQRLAWDVFIEHNRLFHRTIVNVGGNLLLKDAIDKLQLPIMMVQVGRLMEDTNIDQSEHDHALIADAILDGDPKRAEEAMQDHLRELADWVLSLPDSAFKREEA
ncbi:GntR family transcriptional regulator [Tepidamorphus sp. 3E244]|uniref:GntR family transcriptional regulator n=1 Tax=Tepidamorphus sp. 3E244 TaxID=3385498 RepID=UPI0038FCE94B